MTAPAEPTERQAAARAWLLGPGPTSPAQTRVKLCGMSRDADVAALAELEPDLVGFVVDVPRSRRNVSPARLAELAGDVEVLRHTWRVGVFVDEPMDELAGIVRSGVLDLVQLHGHEDASYVEELRRRTGVGVIQAFRLREPADAERAQASAADLVLLDNGAGGTGESFDWSLARLVTRPFLLAGGIGPGNVAEAIGAVRPWGVDMSSSLETDGHKDPRKMRTVVEAVRGIERKEA